MKIKNISGGILAITDIINVDGSKGLTLQIDSEADVFHGEDSRSEELKSLIVSKWISVVGATPIVKEETKEEAIPAPAVEVEKKTEKIEKKPEVKKSAKKAKK